MRPDANLRRARRRHRRRGPARGADRAVTGVAVFALPLAGAEEGVEVVEGGARADTVPAIAWPRLSSSSGFVQCLRAWIVPPVEASRPPPGEGSSSIRELSLRAIRSLPVSSLSVVPS